MLKLDKCEFYYVAKDADALVLMATTGIRLRRNGICMFNAEYLKNVENVLRQYDIPYCIFINDEVVRDNKGNEKKYDDFLKLGTAIKNLQNRIDSDVRRIKSALNNINQL